MHRSNPSFGKAATEQAVSEEDFYSGNVGYEYVRNANGTVKEKSGALD
jgi:hypothetical protein